MQALEISQMEQIEGGWLRCAAGIVGAALLGGLEGAAAGFEVPVIGNAIGGGLTGGAAVY